MAVFERDENFGNSFLAKLITAITFAPGIRMTIIIYAFGVLQTQKISRLLSFFLFFIFQVL